MRIVRRGLLALLILLLVAGYWLLVDNRPGAAQPKPITIAQLRILAAAIPGQVPSGVEMERVTGREVPATLFAAGLAPNQRETAVMVFRLPVPGGQPVMMDSGLSRAAAESMQFSDYDAAAQQRIDTQLRGAGLVLFTHEHIDHQGGLLALNDPAALAKARFNPGQLPGNRWSDMLPWPAPPLPAATITGTQPQAVAPGIVVIPAASHTPGSQMVFVRLADGREFLFTGDIATLAESWQEIRARSRLVGDFLAPESRAEVFAWLRTIQAWHREAPAMQIIPGHDLGWITDDPAKRGVRIGFAPQAPGR